MVKLNAEDFIMKLLRNTPPIHRDDLRQLAALISPLPDLVNTLKKKGRIKAINGFRTVAEKDMKYNRLKSKVIIDALLGIIEWERQHSEELSYETIIALLDKALKKGIVPYTEAYQIRQATYISKGLDDTELSTIGVQIDFYDRFNKKVYIHLLDDTQDINKCLVRSYLIKAIEAKLCATAEVQIYTDNKVNAARQYYNIYNKQIHQVPYEHKYYSFIYGLYNFIGF